MTNAFKFTIFSGSAGSLLGKTEGGTFEYRSGSGVSFLVCTVSSRIMIPRSSPVEFSDGCWNNDIPVPCSDPLAVVELGLWSMLSTAAVVNKENRNFGGQTTFSSSNLADTPFPIVVDIANIMS